MVSIDRTKVKLAFANYVSGYNADDEKIKLKIIHTYKVAEICDQISESLSLNEMDKEIAWLLGMLHDVGRFEQIKRYGTFNDALSVDHAKFGADLLFNEGLLEAFVPGLLYEPEKDLIELAIRQHNAYRIMEGLSERELLFCKIIRDADKVDIIRVNIETRMEDIYDVTTEQLLNDVISDAVLEAFDEEHCILKSIRKTSVDQLVGHISLAFELEFQISLLLVKQQGYMEQMLSFVSKNSKTNEQMKHVNDKMKDFVMRSI